MKNVKLDELNQAFGTIKKEFETLKADLAAPGSETCTKGEVWAMLDRCMSSVYSMVDNMRANINEVDNYHYQARAEHQKGHLPPFKTAAHLEKFLKVTGMDDSYDVQKQAIYASTNRGLEITIDYSQAKK